MTRTPAFRPTAPELTAAVLGTEIDGDPVEIHAALRSTAPVVWSEDPPIWVLSRHADVAAVNKDTARFISASGILPLEIGLVYDEPPSMMHTDPPEHTRLRRAVAEGFRPSRIRELEPAVRKHVEDLIDQLPVDAPFDVVEDLAAPLPLMVMCNLLGLPSDDWRIFWEWSDSVVPGAGELSEDERERLRSGLEKLLRDHIRGRRQQPSADIVSDLMAAPGDGVPLDDDEVYILLNQLLVAGNETTRNLLSGGLLALAQRPQQWARVREMVTSGDSDALSTVVEEMLRFTTPVVGFMRTAATDTEVAGQVILAGEHVLMLWASANRDEAEFGPNASELVVDRRPNNHLAFGYGAHFCVGAALARLEARLVLIAMSERFGTLEVAGAVNNSASTVVAGLSSAMLSGASAAPSGASPVGSQ